ncbi:hypothetical protein DFA_02917 [Cavenderia fasciculata]|uniref:Uncharacterized protein n=1 Tax=Cavenderia fasciculata TaxID=261658 RepID=F4PIU4_CACFS|nr:uncharacterized protein DFA_02917 [Cavenderia fasciculata]EGG24673.1 hypothetical protein DFA_02917 [Cavenderia fasciculata]|eukprot:XP_004362524.1 hypothetical protein DFA_02917 [Cavenderia fasciculata]
MDMLTEQSKTYRDVTEMEMDALRKELLELRDTHGKAGDQLRDCKTAIQALQSSNREKEDKIQYYKQSVESNNLVVEIQHKNLQNLKQDQNSKQSQIDALSNTIEQSTKTIQNITEQQNQLSEQQKGEIQNKTAELSQVNSAYQGESAKLKDQTVQLNSLSSLLRSQMKAFETSQNLQKDLSSTEQKKLLLLLQDLENGLNKASQTITEQSNQNNTLRKELEESKKYKEEQSQLNQQISMMKDRLINSENQLIDRECENTLLQDKLKMWEEEIKIKDAKLGLLETNVKEVRAEYENGMAFSRELTNPTNAASNKKLNRKSKALSAEEQFENMRESSIAHQTHNAFLNLQLQRLENEMRQQEKVYSETIQRIKRDLQQRNQQNIAFMKQQAGDEVVLKLQEVTATFENLKKKYFVSLVVAAKLQHSMMGDICNVDAYEMYEQAQSEHVLDQDQWPNWVAENISKKK